MAPSKAPAPAPSPRKTIALRGVRTHNLRAIDVDVPLGCFTVVTGVSGSGKSSLAFDTLYAEGQRRYVESLSAYTRQFLERMDRPDVDRVSGIPPAIAVQRRPPAKTSRSTVGTVTEILDYLRMLYARVAVLRCLGCGEDVERRTTTGITDEILAAHENERATLVFPLARIPDTDAIAGLKKAGYHRMTRDGRDIFDLEDGDVSADGHGPFYVVADRLRLTTRDRGRLAESLEASFQSADDRAGLFLGDRLVPLVRGLSCPRCDRVYERPSPQHFSFNSPIGACPRCRGFGDVIDVDLDRVVPDRSRSITDGAIAPFQSGRGTKWQRKLLDWAKDAGVRTDVPFAELSEAEASAVFDGDGAFKGVRGFFSELERKIYKLPVRVLLSRYRRYVRCDACDGARLVPETLAYHVSGRSIADVCQLSIARARAFFTGLELDGQTRETAEPLLFEIRRRLDVMERAGLDYLTLARASRTLSGGEYQRILLAGALGSGLTGTLYVLDEPSVGLHARDAERLLSILLELRDRGNTVVVVEHDRDLIAQADHVIDLGPGAGENGGRVVHEGTPGELLESGKGETAEYFTGKKALPAPRRRDLSQAKRIGVRGARAYNLDDMDVDVPLGGIVCVTGVSGSGKSTLVEETLYEGYRSARKLGTSRPGEHRRLLGLHHVTDVVMIDQSPIGRTPRSNPVTYMKAFDGVRRLFAGTAAARREHLTAGDFSFNVSGGRCESCEGAGQNRIELQFLADLFVTCEACSGRRYQDRVLGATYRGKSIHDVLAMTVVEAVSFFGDTPRVARPLWQLTETGLGYLRLGQSATTLSGGEAQRLKIAHHLARKVSGNALFILDEPTTGLHVADIGKLLGSLDRLVARGHSVLVVEHNLDVIARADHLIDLGPEGGEGGGRVVATGTPAAVAADPASVTGRHLARYLERWERP